MAFDLDAALAGISGILVTPYDEAGDIAPGKLAPIIDRAVGAGVHLPVVNGNTGEFYALTTDEACTMVQARSPAGRRPRARCWRASVAASATPAGWRGRRPRPAPRR